MWPLIPPLFRDKHVDSSLHAHIMKKAFVCKLSQARLQKSLMYLAYSSAPPTVLVLPILTPV